MSAPSTWTRDLTRRARAEIESGQAAEREARHRDARAAYERALYAMGPSAPPAAAAALLRWVGRTWIHEADFDAAEDCLLAALTVAEAAGDEHAVAHALNVRAYAAQLQGHLDDAERLYVAARTHASVSGDGELAAMLEQNLGTVANVRGRLEDALAHYRAGLSGFRALGLEERAGLLANNLGMLYSDLRQWPEAERAFAEAQAICVERGDVDARMRVDANLAEMWIARGHPDRARALCEGILEESRRGGDGAWLGEAYKCFGVICRDAGDLEAAAGHLRRAADLAEQRRDLLLAAETSRERADLYARLGRNRDMLRQLNRAHKIFDTIRARRDLADVGRRLKRLEDQFLQIVRDWSDSIERKDPYTLGHCERVAGFAGALAARLGFDEQDLFWIQVGGTLHDVGKIVVPSEVLNKPGALTPEERQVMERHAAEGAAMLSDIDFPADVLPMVRHHHERWDGSGYPDRIAGESIPLAARILCVADVYDALTTTRSYRPAHSRERAVQIMSSESGRTFDPRVLDAFLTLVDEGSERRASAPRRSLTPLGTPAVQGPPPGMGYTPPRGTRVKAT